MDSQISPNSFLHWLSLLSLPTITCNARDTNEQSSCVEICCPCTCHALASDFHTRPGWLQVTIVVPAYTGTCFGNATPDLAARKKFWRACKRESMSAISVRDVSKTSALMLRNSPSAGCPCEPAGILTRSGGTCLSTYTDISFEIRSEHLLQRHHLKVGPILANSSMDEGLLSMPHETGRALLPMLQPSTAHVGQQTQMQGSMHVQRHWTVAGVHQA